MCTSRRHDLNLEFAGGLGQDVLPNRRVSNAPTDRLAVFPAERFAEYRCMCPEDRETVLSNPFRYLYVVLVTPACALVRAQELGGTQA